MKSINADLNRRGPNDTVIVASRRFEMLPAVGERFIVNDGADKFEGTVTEVHPERRSVVLRMSWEANMNEHMRRFVVTTGNPGARSGSVRTLSGASHGLRSDVATERGLASV